MTALQTASLGSANILLVQTEASLAERLNTDLRAVGYRVQILLGPVQAETVFAAVETDHPDLIILDRGEGGLKLCRGLRQAGYVVPVLLLTDGDAVADRAAGLDVGADDYMARPFGAEELLSRIHYQLKRVRGKNDGILRLADLMLNPQTREVRRAERVIELTSKEYDLLKYLLEHPRDILSREQILSNVWGYSFVGESNIVEVYIRYLRMKLEREGDRKLIHTVRGAGYMLRD